MGISYINQMKKTDDIYNLYKKLGWNDFLKLKPEQISKAMDNSWFVIYAYDNDLLVGTGRIVSDGMTNAYLCGLGVLPEFRHRGIGTMISSMLVDTSKKHKLHIQFFSEEKLVPLYEKIGFEQFAVGMRDK